MPRIEARIEEIKQRQSQIATEIDGDGADLDALEEEARGLSEELRSLRTSAERKEEIRNALKSETAHIVRPGEVPEQRIYDADSTEYRSAFFKNLLGVELNREERAAFVHTTANTANVLPTQTLNNIWDLVSTQHSIMGDITVYRTGTIIEVLKHTAIAAGDAATVSENTANEDEKNTFAKVTLSGKDFSKSVDISYAMERMSVDALESYLTGEIARQLGAAMATDVVTQIKADMAEANASTTAAVGKIDFAELAEVFGSLERADHVCVYAKRSTVYKYLVGMVDSNKRPIFQPSAQVGAEGVVLGAQIKIEDAVADGQLLIGDASKVVYNMVQDIMIENDRDIKKHVTTYSGYARGSGALIADKAFATLTVKTAAS